MSLKVASLMTLFLVAIVVWPSPASGIGSSGEDKIDAPLRMVMEHDHSFLPVGEILPVILKLRNEPTRQQLVRLIGFGTLESIIDNIVTMRVRSDSIRYLALLDFVERIEGSMLERPMTDVSVAEIGAPKVWNEIKDAKGSSVDGSKTLIGILDTGVDLRHPDLRFPNGTTKLLFLWDQTQKGAPPSGYSYGIECDRKLIESGDCREFDTNGHGTHVSAIAASSGMAKGNYRGVAPGAAIVFVKGGSQTVGGWRYSSAEILDGVAYIARKARELGLRVVINLSLGGYYGPRDGTAAYELALDRIVEQGTVVVVAAGNAGFEGSHASGSMSKDSTVNLRFNLDRRESYVTVDLWYPGSDLFGIQVTTSEGQTADRTTRFGNNYLWITTSQSSRIRGALIEMYNPDGLRPGWSVTLKGVTVAGGGQWDAWLGSSYIATGFASESGYKVDRDSTVTVPGTARNVITVGAYVTKLTWMAKNGTQISPYSNYPQFGIFEKVGDLAYFSSRGPTKDGRIKPEVVGPGRAIAAARSSGLTSSAIDPDDDHTVFSGTSMSTPHVTGLVALILHKNPTLTPVQIRSLLMSTARQDSFTGILDKAKGSTAWGFGKIDAYASSSGRLSATITVKGLPENIEVPLFVNGSPKGTLSVRNPQQLEIDPKSPLNVTVPQSIGGGDGVRYFAKSNQWIAAGETSHVFEYMTQYLLTLVSEYGQPKGSGWYDADSQATIFVDDITLGTGFLGALGVRFYFVQWFGKQNYDTNQASVRMSSPLTLTAVWRADYTPLYALVGVIVAVIAVGAIVMIRKRLSGKAAPMVQPTSSTV